MAPKKYVGHLKYENKRLQDDFLEALLECKEGQDAHKEWKSLAREVCPRLKDKYAGVVDTYMPTKGLQIFRWWYGQANLGSPNDSVWKFDLGKLVVPIVFKDVDLLYELVSRYDEITHKVKDINCRVFLKINVDSI